MLDIKVKTKDFLRAIRIVENAITDDTKGGIYIETTEDNKLEFKAIGSVSYTHLTLPTNREV